MSDRRLQVFHAVAGVLSFTRAAELLNMTQPAVTHQIRQLEADFDTRLFDRENNRISLTAAGEQVLEYANQIIALYGEMHESVKSLTGDTSGLVTLGASTTIAEYMLPGLLGDFLKKFPNVQVRLKVANTDAVVSMVGDNTIDLGIVEGVVNNQYLLVEDCQADELRVIVPPEHPLASKQTLEPADLLNHPFISREEGSGTRSVIARFLEQHGYSEEQLIQSFELGSTEAIKGAVQAGMGISIVSAAALVKEEKLAQLISIPTNPPILRTFYFVRQPQKFRTHLMEELFQFAHQYCATGPA